MVDLKKISKYALPGAVTALTVDAIVPGFGMFNIDKLGGDFEFTCGTLTSGAALNKDYKEAGVGVGFGLGKMGLDLITLNPFGLIKDGLTYAAGLGYGKILSDE